MELLKIQKRFIKSKIIKNIIIKCKGTSGNLEALLHRILYLKSNYDFEKEDKILLVEKNHKKIKDIRNKYKIINDKFKYDYYSLLQDFKMPDILSYNELIENYIGLKKEITNKEKIEILSSILENINNKKINKDNVFLIINEIKYMKINRIQNIEEYKVLMGAPLKLRKNSLNRSVMYEVFISYNKELLKRNLYDEEDLSILAINSVNNNKYTHVLVNNAQDFSKLELDFLRKICRNKSYSTFTAMIDLDKNENIYSSLIKKKRVYIKKYFKDSEKKIYNFVPKNKLVKKNEFNIKNINEYVFTDLKYHNNYKFSIDDGLDNNNFIINNEEVISNEDLNEVPVYTNIAAGEPILINPQIEDSFKLPKYITKGSYKKFILKVKGDSMIDANIHNGDLVLIEQNPVPVNGDIVAVNIEGSATLKTLKIEKDKIVLLPQNKNYSPIIITKNEEFYVLGKAIGVISKS